MKTFTKLALAAASGYAFRAYLKRDTLTSNDALKHSVDRRLSVEGYNRQAFDGFKSPFMNRQVDKLTEKVVDRVHHFLYQAPISNSRYSRQSSYGRHYYRPTRYSRFGRN